MVGSRPSKAACLDGFATSIGCVDTLGPRTFPRVDVFDPSTRVSKTEASQVVDSRAALLDAIDDHDPGDVIWVDGVVDMGDAEGIELDDVTLASGYGTPGAATGELHTTEKPAPLFVAHDDVRITGLKLHADEFEYFDPSDRYPGENKPIFRVGASTGVFVTGDGVEIDNLELSGWTYAGVSVRREGRDDVSTHLHHLDVVDNPAGSLGYGLTVVEGCPLIECNYFDNNRHSIAGSGWEHCSYVVRFNVVGDYATNHAIDMHGEPQSGSRPIAGRRIRIYDNVVKLRRSHLTGDPQPAIKIRGRPIERGEIVGNWFFNGTERVNNRSAAVPVRQLFAPRDAFRNLRVADNRYGTESPGLF